MGNEVDSAKKKAGRPKVHPAHARSVRFTISLSPWEAHFLGQLRRCAGWRDLEQERDLSQVARLLILEHIEQLKQTMIQRMSLDAKLNGGTRPPDEAYEKFDRLMQQEADVDDDEPEAVQHLEGALAALAAAGKP